MYIMFNCIYIIYKRIKRSLQGVIFSFLFPTVSLESSTIYDLVKKKRIDY